MATAISVEPSPSGFLPGIPPEPIYRLSVAQYHEMIEQGILQSGEPIELLEGWLVQKMTKNRPHSLVTGQLRDMLLRLLHGGYYVDSQEPITMLESEPEPDVFVVRGKRADYPASHPHPSNVPLVIEVADSTLLRDRGIKKRLYARAGIPAYWIVNLIDRQIEVYSQPSGPTAAPDYGNCQVVAEAGEVNLVIDGREVAKLAVKDLLA